MNEVKLPWYPNVFLSSDGVLRIKGTCPFITDLEDKVSLVLRGETHTLDKRFLYWFVKFDYPEIVRFSDVSFYQLPYGLSHSPINMHAIFHRPIMILPGFRLCASRPRLAVSRDGKVYDVRRKRLRKLSAKEKHGYFVVMVYNPMYGYSTTYPVHRLVANAWLMKKQNQAFPEVNHKDGNKQNNRVENLEWCDRSNNQYHAQSTGLILTRRPCKVLNVVTQEIASFPSSTEAAVFMRLDEKLIQSNQQHRNNRLFSGKWEFKYDDDPRPWQYLGNFELMSTGSSRYLITIDEPDGTRRLFNGVIPFCRWYRIWKLKGHRGKSAASMRDAAKQFRISYPGYKIRILDRHPFHRVQLRNIFTGEVTEYRTTEMAANAIGCEPTSLSRIVKKHKIYRQYQTRPYSNEPWPEVSEADLDTLIEVSPMYGNTTLDVQYFVSQQEAADAFGLSRSAIKLALNRGYLIDVPYRIKEICRYDKNGDRAERLIMKSQPSD